MRALPLLAVSLLLTGAFAGCINLSEGLTPSSLALPDLLPPHFKDAVAMEQPTGGAEPNMAILPDGTLFITAVAGSQERPNALQGAAWLWRSKDGGETWETLREPMRETPLGGIPATRKPFGSSDADVVASPDGWVYYTDWWNWGSPVAVGPRAGNYLVERSSDGGDTWESTPVTIPDPTAIDRQWLVAGEDGFVALVYAYFHPVQNTARGAGDPFGRGEFIMSIQGVFSRDHGATWSGPVTVVEPVPDRSYQIAHPTILPDGTLVMPFGEVGPGTNYWRSPASARVAISDDQGASWYLRTVAKVPQGFDNLWAVQGASDARGNLVVAWAARTHETMTVFVRESADKGETWTEPVALRADGLNFLPWVAARGDGQAAVGWYGGDSTGDPLEAKEDAEWFAYVAERKGAGLPFAVGKVSDQPVKTGPLCPRGASCGANNRELLDYVSLAYDADGMLHYAFAKSRELDGGVKAGLVHYAGALAG